MTIAPKMEQAIEKQINAELYSAYLYLSMAAYFLKNNLPGFAHWMKKQASEEVGHAMKFFDYIFERNGNVVLDAITKPLSNWKSPLAVFTESYNHEQKVTKMIYALIDVTDDLNDYATESFLKWFIDEQVEEEDSARTIMEHLKSIGESKGALYQLDHKLSKRE